MQESTKHELFSIITYIVVISVIIAAARVLGDLMYRADLLDGSWLIWPVRKISFLLHSLF